MENNISHWAELSVSGMANSLYKKLVSYLDNKGKKISDFGEKIKTHIYPFEGHGIRIDYNKNVDKVHVKVRGDDSSKMIQKLNSLDPIPF